jgi:hypothetical protein
VGRGGVGRGAELPEITAAAERRPLPREQHLLDRRVGDGDLEGLGERIAHRGREGVAPLRPIEREPQTATLALHPHRRAALLRTRLRRRPLREPRSKFGSALQRRVGERLGHEAVDDREPLAPAQQLHEHQRRDRSPVDAFEHVRELLDAIDAHVGAIGELGGRGRQGRAPDGDRGARQLGEPRLRKRELRRRQLLAGVEIEDQDARSGERREASAGIGEAEPARRLRDRHGLRFPSAATHVLLSIALPSRGTLPR